MTGIDRVFAVEVFLDLDMASQAWQWQWCIPRSSAGQRCQPLSSDDEMERVKTQDASIPPSVWMLQMVSGDMIASGSTADEDEVHPPLPPPRRRR